MIDKLLYNLVVFSKEMAEKEYEFSGLFSS